MTRVRLLHTASFLWSGLLIGCIIASSLEMSLTAGLRRLVETRWGVTTLVDLYGGLLVVLVWIACCERRWTRTLAWGIGLALLGNLATLVYVARRAQRARTVREVFMPAPPPGSSPDPASA